ncbi:MAG: ATP-grasp domain-containing protein [Candidatus Methylomirabilis sp.]|nr:ATP-grasp domain-containing protein [Deltaproteobacteria bacterium]
MKVLVTDGDNRAALAITRSLGKAGHHVVVGERKETSLSSVSSSCRGRFVYPDPVSHPRGFIEALLGRAAEEGIDVIMPVSDISTLLVTGHRHMFTKSRIPFASFETLDMAARKDRLFETARELNIPVPRTVVLKRNGEGHKGNLDIDFPVVVKPHRSRIQGPDGKWLSASVSYASDRNELLNVLGMKKGQYPLLLQERIQGPGIGVFACYDRGALKAIFSHRRLREKPPSGGVSVLCESIPVPALAREYTEALLGRLGWHGVAMVEFKLDERDGVPKLMEINGRFWGSLQLAIDAGVDFPSMLMDIAMGREVRPCFEYRTGVRTRWFWGDVDSLLMVLLKNRRSLQLPPDHPGKLGSILRFLKPSLNGTHLDVLRLNDPRPWFHETSMWFRNQLGRG